MSQLFDARYYAYECGRPYRRDDHWLNFFGEIAESIVRQIQPTTVLDAGCAWGFLVEKLRGKGVEAWGIDISEYAIAKVHESIRPYCWVGSVADPFPQRYELIVCIEVLEHMDAADARKAIVNFCNSTDDILFSSSPYDYKETTHFNIQPPEVWAELFALQGFYRDVDFDASFLTPWAVRFRKRKEPVSRVVREYERRFWTLWKENTDLRTLNLEHNRSVSSLQEQIHTLMEEQAHLNHKIQTLSSKLAATQNRVRHLQRIKRQYDQIVFSRSWRLMTRIHQIRHKLIPIDSRRERYFQAILRSAGALRRKITGSNIHQTGEIPSRKAGRRPYTFEDWIRDFEPSPSDLELQKQTAQTFSHRPLISFLTPVYNPSPEVLRKTIQSVQEQTYTNWELCLANGGDDEAIEELIAELKQQDARIKTHTLAQNLGISGNTNVALKMATGEFVALLDHDDLLAPNMLYEVVLALNAEPDLDIIYFDEDKIDVSGKYRQQPFFKPDWSPEMFLSVNYLTHPVVRRELVTAVGAFDPRKDGTQDWDLLLKCTEKTNRIKHIPKILYHWRQIAGSTSAVYTAKSYVFERQIQSVEEHLQRIGIENPNASFVRPGYLRVTWPLKEEKISIIIPTKDNSAILKKCLNSILYTTKYSNYEVILVDNGSTQPEVLAYYDAIKQDERITIVPSPGTFNFSAALNLGAKNASGQYFLFLNNDIEVLAADWLTELLQWAQRPEIGIVGAKLLYPDRKIQHAGVILGMQGHAGHIFWGMDEWQGTIFGAPGWYRNYLAVTGACMLIPRHVFEEVGGFDEDYQLVFSDIEICLRAVELGYRVLYTPYARLIHHEGKSRGQFMSADDIQRAAKHFHAIIEKGDPYFNPNLSYAARVPVFRKPDEETRLDRLDRLVARWRKEQPKSKHT